MLSVQELNDLFDEVSKSFGSDNILAILSYANRTGTLEDLLESIGRADLLGSRNTGFFERPKKVLVIGDSRVGIDKLKSIVKSRDLDPSVFEFQLGYESLKHFEFRKLRYSDTYGAIIAGPEPHSTPGKRDSSSAIVEIERHPESYPPLIRCINERGVLEITKSSFGKAVDRLIQDFS